MESETKEKHKMELAAKEEEIAYMKANRGTEHEQIQLLEAELKDLKLKYKVTIMELNYKKTDNEELKVEVDDQLSVI